VQHFNIELDMIQGLRFSKEEISAEIEKNIADEATARVGYYKLLSMLLEEDFPVIEEIISDELNHSERLKELSFKYNQIKQAVD